MAQTSSSTPVAIISPQYCCPYPVDLAIVRKVVTIVSAGNIFDVTDINGNLLFKVKEILFGHLRQRKLILDPAGNPIVTLRRKAMTLHSEWQAFKGESTDPKDLVFNAKTHSIWFLTTKLDVFLAHNTAYDVCDFQVKSSYSRQSCAVYAGDEHSNTIIAQMHKNHPVESIFQLGKTKFMVTVNPNMDYAFIVALIVILQDINND